jgi:hypothetical protein
MLYLTNETGPLKLFKRPSYLLLNATFSSFSISPLELGSKVENQDQSGKTEEGTSDKPHVLFHDDEKRLREW